MRKPSWVFLSLASHTRLLRLLIQLMDALCVHLGWHAPRGDGMDFLHSVFPHCQAEARPPLIVLFTAKPASSSQSSGLHWSSHRICQIHCRLAPIRFCSISRSQRPTSIRFLLLCVHRTAPPPKTPTLSLTRCPGEAMVALSLCNIASSFHHSSPLFWIWVKVRMTEEHLLLRLPLSCV